MNINNDEYCHSSKGLYEIGYHELGDGYSEVDEDWNIGVSLSRVEKAVNLLGSAPDSIYFDRGRKDNLSEGFVIYEWIVFNLRSEFKFSSSIVKAFMDLYLDIKVYRELGYLHNRAYSPYITAYIRWMDDVDKVVNNFQRKLAIESKLNFRNYGVDYIGLENNLRQCFLKLHERINEPAFMAAMSQLKQSCDKNYKSVTSYFDGLFEQCSRLLVVRIDLGYTTIHNNNLRKRARTVNDGSVEAQEFIQVKDDIERFLNNQRHNNLFDDLRGYVWKLEFGVRRRYHCHLVLLYDSSKRCRDVHLAKCVGKYWVDTITQGRGTYYNVNAGQKKKFYKYPCTGPVHYSNEIAREGLRHLASYFCKTDYYIRLDLPRRLTAAGYRLGRTLGKGQLKKPVKGKGGRPRSVGLAE